MPSCGPTATAGSISGAGEPEGLHHVAELGNERRIVYFLHVMRPLLIRYRENAFQTLSERRIQDGP
jgi:hypothetical protein